MTASLDVTLYSLANDIISIATQQGYGTTLTSVEIPILGSTIQGSLAAQKRDIIVSATQPPLPPISFKIWLKPSTREFFLGDILNARWAKIYDYSQMFSEQMNVTNTL